MRGFGNASEGSVQVRSLSHGSRVDWVRASCTLRSLTKILAFAFVMAAGVLAAVALPGTVAGAGSVSSTLTTTPKSSGGSSTGWHFGSTGLYVALLLGLVLLMVVPYVIDLVSTQKRQRELVDQIKTNTSPLSKPEQTKIIERATSGAEGLVRTLLTFALISVFAAALFYLLIKNPVTLHYSKIVGDAMSALITLVTAIVAFYFGTRSAQTSDGSDSSPPGDDGTSEGNNGGNEETKTAANAANAANAGAAKATEAAQAAEAAATAAEKPRPGAAKPADHVKAAAEAKTQAAAATKAATEARAQADEAATAAAAGKAPEATAAARVAAAKAKVAAEAAHASVAKAIEAAETKEAAAASSLAAVKAAEAGKAAATAEKAAAAPTGTKG